MLFAFLPRRTQKKKKVGKTRTGFPNKIRNKHKRKVTTVVRSRK